MHTHTRALAVVADGGTREGSAASGRRKGKPEPSGARGLQAAAAGGTGVTPILSAQLTGHYCSIRVLAGQYEYHESIRKLGNATPRHANADTMPMTSVPLTRASYE